MKTLLKIIFLFFITIDVYGTPQIFDRLIINNDTLRIYSNPLGRFGYNIFTDTTYSKRKCDSRNCYRGYIATFQVINDSLFLTEMRDCCNKNLKVKLSVAFKKTFRNGKVHLDWLTDSIYAQLGTNILYQNPYKPIYENELELIFQKGLLISKDTIDNSKTRLTYKKNSGKLSEFFFKNVPKGAFNVLFKEIRVCPEIECDDSGKVTKVTISDREHSKYDKLIIETLQKIDDWDVLYLHGKRIEWKWSEWIVINRKTIKMYSL